MNVKIESPALQSLTIESLKKASEAFGFMIKQPIELKEIALEEIKEPDELVKYLPEQVYMLTTEIIGDMSGKSYLFFDEAVADVVFHLCTGQQVLESNLSLEAVLKEIDNIVSASVISVIANRLKVTIYGDVPHCFESSRNEISHVLKRDFHSFSGEHDQYVMRCEMVAHSAKLKVDFLWVLSGSIVARLTEMAE